MFRELSYASGVVSIVTCGTEIIYRVKERNETDYYYQLQSTYLIAATGVLIPISYLIFRKIAKIKLGILKVLAVMITAVLVVAIFLRSKYNFFMPLKSQYSLYNVTSFFLCLETITFAMLYFYQGPDQAEQDNAMVLEERRRQRRRNGSTASVHEYDDEIDYTLPSYSEVPAPPAYSKSAAIGEDISTSLPEASLNNSMQNDVNNTLSTHVSINVPEPNANNPSTHTTNGAENESTDAENAHSDRQTSTSNITNTRVAASQVVPPE